MKTADFKQRYSDENGYRSVRASLKILLASSLCSFVSFPLFYPAFPFPNIETFPLSRNELLYFPREVSCTQRGIQLLQLRFICTTFTASFMILLCFAERFPRGWIIKKKEKQTRKEVGREKVR